MLILSHPQLRVLFARSLTYIIRQGLWVGSLATLRLALKAQALACIRQRKALESAVVYLVDTKLARLLYAWPWPSSLV